MRYANITGWGKCLPPAVLSNADLTTIMDTSDEWISSRTGIKERRITHVKYSELAALAGKRALACAGQDHRAAAAVALDPVEQVQHTVDHRAGQRIELVGTVEGEDGDAVGDVDENRFWHGAFPACVGGRREGSATPLLCIFTSRYT